MTLDCSQVEMKINILQFFNSRIQKIKFAVLKLHSLYMKMKDNII